MSSRSIGVALGLAAAATFEISYLLLAAQARDLAPADHPGASFFEHLARRPWWLAAMALNGVAFALELAALREASLLIIQPLLAVGLIGLLLGARVFLGERVTPRRLFAVIGIAVGLTLVVEGAPPHSARTGLGLDPASVLVAAVLIAILLLPNTTRGRSPWLLVAAAMAGDTVVALAANQIAADWTGHLLLSLGGVLVVAVCGLTSVTSESAALQRLPASTVGPLVSAAQVVLPVLLLALLAHERWASAPGGGALLAAGVALTAVSAYELADVRAAGAAAAQARA